MSPSWRHLWHWATAGELRQGGLTGSGWTKELRFPARRKTADNPEWVWLASELRAHRQRIWQLDVDAPAAERRAAAAGARASGLVPYTVLSALMTLSGHFVRRQERSRP